MGLKQAILIRKDIKMSPGKLSAQVAHASVEAVLKSNKDVVAKWRKEGMKKIVLKVAKLDELLNYKRDAENVNLVTALITDAGKTQVEEGTITCLAIGPDEEEKIDKITNSLKLI